MKPDGAKELLIGSDLSECAIESAIELMGIDLKNICNDTFQKGPSGNITIKVASQQIGLALMLRRRVFSPINLINMVDISFDYAPDEWSVHLSNYGNNPINGCVWSPGV